MPFIISKVNVPVTHEQERRLAAGFGEAIAVVPGKTEASLMLGFEANSRLYLRGDDDLPMAYVTVAVFGNAGHRGYEQLSFAIARLFHETLGIDPNRIFVKYEDIPVWSVAGRTFSGSPASLDG